MTRDKLLSSVTLDLFVRAKPKFVYSYWWRRPDGPWQRYVGSVEGGAIIGNHDICSATLLEA